MRTLDAPSPSQRGVLDDHLDAVAALPIVVVEVAGNVEHLVSGGTASEAAWPEVKPTTGTIILSV